MSIFASGSKPPPRSINVSGFVIGPALVGSLVHAVLIVYDAVGDVIVAFAENLVRLGDEAGQVVAMAGRRECAGNADENDAAAFEKLLGRSRLRTIRRH